MYAYRLVIWLRMEGYAYFNEVGSGVAGCLYGMVHHFGALPLDKTMHNTFINLICELAQM
jgi:hypothetical protein